MVGGREKQKSPRRQWKEKSTLESSLFKRERFVFRDYTVKEVSQILGIMEQTRKDANRKSAGDREETPLSPSANLLATTLLTFNWPTMFQVHLAPQSNQSTASCSRGLPDCHPPETILESCPCLNLCDPSAGDHMEGLHLPPRATGTPGTELHIRRGREKCWHSYLRKKSWSCLCLTYKGTRKKYRSQRPKAITGSWLTVSCKASFNSTPTPSPIPHMEKKSHL